jgi:hypothetical protein
MMKKYYRVTTTTIVRITVPDGADDEQIEDMINQRLEDKLEDEGISAFDDIEYKEFLE